MPMDLSSTALWRRPSDLHRIARRREPWRYSVGLPTHSWRCQSSSPQPPGRRSAVRGEDLDLGRGEFSVRPETSKFGRGRTVSLDPHVVRELDRYLRDRTSPRTPEASLFPTRTDEPYTIDGFTKLFERIRRRSGLRAFSAHLLRHTWATTFMRFPGAHLLELKRQGGWERWEMLERYSHAVPMTDRTRLPDPLALGPLTAQRVHKTAFDQPPSARISRLSVQRAERTRRAV